MTKSDLEAELAFQMKVVGLPEPEREYRFHKTRRWRFDFCFPDKMIGIEAEGGTWTQGRHSRGSGYEKDCEKYSEAAIDGWIVLRFTKGMIQSGKAIEMIERAYNE